MTFRRIPRSSCNEALRVVQEAWEDFTPKVSTVGTSSSQEERSPGISKSRGFAQGDNSCPSGISYPVLFTFVRAPGPVAYGQVGRVCLFWELDFVYQSKFMQTERPRQKCLRGASAPGRHMGLQACPVWEEALTYGDREGGSQWLDVNSLRLCPRPWQKVISGVIFEVLVVYP